MNKYKVAIIGCGSRGSEIYGRLIMNKKEQFELVALCDINPIKLEKYSKVFNVRQENTFLNEEEFLKVKRADILVIATQDKSHVRIATKALDLGYHLLLEKPISDSIDECNKLLEVQKKNNKQVIVCHVLRYAKAFLKVNELINEGVIGDLRVIQALEQVGWFHQAHSYVRGNWHNTKETTPMIMAKCCHDLDLLQYYAKSRCKIISSMGNLSFFNKEHKPEGSAKRCLDCKFVDTCPYSAKVIYIGGWYKYGCPVNQWPFNTITEANPLTEEALYESIKSTDYGKCVFDCDNDAVDNQVVMMEFENGVKATLTMTGFTGDVGRIMKFYGTYGEIDLDEEKGVIEVKRFAQDKEVIDINSLVIEDKMNHGGGDYMLVESLYNAIETGKAETTLESSIESHLMAIYAEESRLNNAKTIEIHK